MRGRRFFVEVPNARYYEPQNNWFDWDSSPEKWTSSDGRQHFQSKRRAIRHAERLADRFGEAIAGYRQKDKQGNVIADRVWTITRLSNEKEEQGRRG